MLTSRINFLMEKYFSKLIILLTLAIPIIAAEKSDQVDKQPDPEFFPCYMTRGILRYCNDKNYRYSHSQKLKSISIGQSAESRPPKPNLLNYQALNKVKKKSPFRAIRLTKTEELELSKKINRVLLEQKNARD